MNICDVILQVRLSCETHWAAVDSAFEDSLVRVLSQMIAQRLTSEKFLADLTFNFHLRVLIDWQSVQRFVIKKLGMRVGAVNEMNND